MELLGGNCSYIKENNVLCKKWECKSWKKIFTQEMVDGVSWNGEM